MKLLPNPVCSFRQNWAKCVTVCVYPFHFEKKGERPDYTTARITKCKKGKTFCFVRKLWQVCTYKCWDDDKVCRNFLIVDVMKFVTLGKCLILLTVLTRFYSVNCLTNHKDSPNNSSKLISTLRQNTRNGIQLSRIVNRRVKRNTRFKFINQSNYPIFKIKNCCLTLHIILN